MAIVIDASVVVAVITNENTKQALVEATSGEDLIAPGSIRWEIGNALSAMVRRNRATDQEAFKALRLYQEIPIREVDVDLEGALEIAARHLMYAYDAYMLRCSVEYRIPIISLDAGLKRVAVAEGIPLVEY
jgi:predicted nucleic acid-binding protein